MKHVGALDGLRAVAIAAVLANHVIPTRGGGGGWLGVDVFFVLSGYLITTILMSEWDRTGAIGLRRFYIRRALRLYPALITLVLAGAIFAPLLGNNGTARGYLLTSLVTLAYLTDLAVAAFANSFGGLGHTWSLAVEEHFYLAWPLLLVFALKRGRDPRWIASAGIVVSVAFLAASGHKLVDGVPASYYSPQTQACAPLAGCLLALWLHRRTAGKLPGGALALVAAGGLGALFLAAGFLPRVPYLFPELAAAVVLTAFLILGVIEAPTSLVSRLLAVRPLRYIGKISYGIYLFHLPIITVLDHYMTGSRAVMYAVAVPAAVLAAALSYRFIERPFLRRKDALAPARPAPGRHARIDLTEPASELSQ